MATIHLTHDNAATAVSGAAALWMRLLVAAAAAAQKTLSCILNMQAFGQTRFAAAEDSMEHISEEKFLLQIFSKMGDLMI